MRHLSVDNAAGMRQTVQKEHDTHAIFRVVGGALMLAALAMGGCSKDESTAGAIAGSTACRTLCVRCDKPGSLQIAGTVQQQTWPLACSSCGRHGAYPAQSCGACGRDAAMMDTRTRGYGEPATCPHCGKPWKAQATTRPPG